MSRLPVRLRGRVGTIRLLAPLAECNYALLMPAALVSLLGDGFFTVAWARQVCEISNVPSALSIVSVAAPAGTP